SLGASVKPVDQPTDDQCVDIFRYPREIAALRNAYGASNAQNPTLGDKAAGLWPSLSVNLTDTTNRSDEPPDFSKVQSPLSQEAALMAFAAEMQRKHYRYIGINGSNPLDVVLLVSFLRSAVPNARLFSFDSDLLLQHEPDNIPYIGTLSVATYPLLYPPLNRIGEISEMSTRLPFTSQREEGIYNATVCIVREMLKDDKLGYLSERNDCSETNPPLWLTAFGVGGHWPIEVLRPAPGPELNRLPLPSSWKAACALLWALVLLHVLLLFGLARFSPKFQAFKLGTVAPARQLFGIHTASATLALALALVALSAWTTNRWTCASEWLVWILPSTCWLLTFKYFRWWWADKAKALEERYLRPRPRRHTLWSQGFLFLGIWLGAASLAYMWWTLLNELDGYYGAFFSFRALHLPSIVSPLAPMLPLLASIYIGAIFYVWHLLFNDKIRPRLNPSREKSPGEDKLRAWLRRFFFDDEIQPKLNPNSEKSPGEDKLRPGWRSEKFIAKAVNDDVLSVIIGGLILSLWCMVFHQPHFELFERRQFQTLFEILFGLVILLILVSAFRLARIWQKLRRFLLEVNRQRARRVLSQLKSDGFSWASIWFYGSEDPDWDYMVQSFEVLQELWNTPDRPLGSEDIDAAIKKIRRTRRTLQDKQFFHLIKMEKVWQFFKLWIAGSDGELEKAMNHAQDLLATTLNDVLDRLLSIWGYPPSTHERIEQQRLLEKYVALRWVAFIRAVIGRIRLLIIFLAISFSLAMISLVIYSFEPHRELLWSVTALFIGIGLLTITVLIQMHRDPILSRITNTKPGKLDITFYIRLVALGAGPLVTLLATHFPSIGRSVVSFLQPGLEALK
ncbi:MAG TPA: hypothetical protein VFF39_00950, partial [Verrucomicrobiae bacterium]|nr:hypothetical protein [Verrucomicrobiae bacterium]